MHIAIYDDEEIFRTYLREFLTRESFAEGSDILVTEFVSGEALLEAFGGENFRTELCFIGQTDISVCAARPGPAGRVRDTHQVFEMIQGKTSLIISHRVGINGIEGPAPYQSAGNGGFKCQTPFFGISMEMLSFLCYNVHTFISHNSVSKF